jgi:hypothetical protein
MAGRLESDAALGMRSRLPEAPHQQIPPASPGSLVGITILARGLRRGCIVAPLRDSSAVCVLKFALCVHCVPTQGQRGIEGHRSEFSGLRENTDILAINGSKRKENG